MAILLDIIVTGVVYFIGFSNGMRYSDGWWKEKLNKMIEDIKEDMKNESNT